MGLDCCVENGVAAVRLSSGKPFAAFTSSACPTLPSPPFFSSFYIDDLSCRYVVLSLTRLADPRLLLLSVDLVEHIRTSDEGESCPSPFLAARVVATRERAETKRDKRERSSVKDRSVDEIFPLSPLPGGNSNSSSSSSSIQPQATTSAPAWDTAADTCRGIKWHYYMQGGDGGHGGQRVGRSSVPLLSYTGNTTKYYGIYPTIPFFVRL
ncbi:hypothetical protein IWZ01DRAFT_114533 [Phyllosticta capitalensis]